MKLSISLPDDMASEIKDVAKKSERHVSWWIQKAWTIARCKLLEASSEEEKTKKHSMKLFSSLRGILESEYPQMDSVTLGKQSFSKKK